jgi:uncharacterized protein DUF6152
MSLMTWHRRSARFIVFGSTSSWRTMTHRELVVWLFYNSRMEELQMKALLARALVVLALLSAAVPLSAHHSWPVNTSHLVTVKGTVTEFAWENPHPMITLEVRTDDGNVEKWSVGGPAISRMEANGWTKTTVKPGDVITGIGYQFSNGQKVVRLEHVVLADGRKLRVYGR